MIRLAGLLLLLLAVPAAAQQHPSDPPLCPATGTPTEWRHCIAGVLSRLDAQLDSLETRRDSLEVRLRLAADSATLRQLDAASAAWVAYRDADCRVDAGVYEGGTLAPVAGLACRVERTRERIGVLEARLRDSAWAERIERDEWEEAAPPCER